MSATLSTPHEEQEPGYLPEAKFSVVRSEAAQRYLPLFNHLQMSQPQKLQLIADLLTIVDHALDACLDESGETETLRDPMA